MSIWFDKRLLEMWFRLKKMPDTRIAKQVVFGPGPGALPNAGRTGSRRRTWSHHVAEVMQEWGVNEAQAAGLSYYKFKRLLSKQALRVWERRLEAERAQRPTLDAYLSRLGAGQVQLKAPQPYLRGGEGCNRGKELVFQIRTGSLLLASLTGKFGRQRRDCPDDPSHFCCPACSGAEETLAHFMLDCPAYGAERAAFWQELEDSMDSGRWQTLQGMSGSEQAFALVNDGVLGPGMVAGVVSPFVYACWEARNAIRSLERGADGSDARA